MTKSEYYRLLVETSKGGGFPAYNQTQRVCVYRSPDGKRCAVGLLIPDDKYVRDMDAAGNALDLFAAFPGLQSVIPEGLSKRDLFDIQGCHDQLRPGADKPWGCETDEEYSSYRWDHDQFVRMLDALPCFGGMTQTTTQ
jgi:hypothetical protein